MLTIPLRAKGSFTLVVKPEHLASRFKDSMLPPVLATPIMILAMENAALNAIREYLEPGESAVGTAVDVRHLAATPLGQQVTAEAEVIEVDGRRIVFAVTARDEVEEIERQWAMQLGAQRFGELRATLQDLATGLGKLG